MNCLLRNASLPVYWFSVVCEDSHPEGAVKNLLIAKSLGVRIIHHLRGREARSVSTRIASN